MTMIIINVGLLIIALILAKTIIKQKKLILCYDNNLKKQGNMRRLIFLANLAKTCGHDMVIDYSTTHDYTYVLFYKNGWESEKFATFFAGIYDDESFEEAIKNLKRLIK